MTTHSRRLTVTAVLILTTFAAGAANSQAVAQNPPPAKVLKPNEKPKKGEKAPGPKVLTGEEKMAAEVAKGKKALKATEALFTTPSPLKLTLTTNIRRIRGDKADNTPWRAATISYVDDKGKTVEIPTQIKTRGIWRRKNCDFPPIRMNFKSELVKGTLLQGLDKPKLTNFCRDTDAYEQYMLQEMQLYRIYNVLTPASHRVRLVELSYVDSASTKLHARRYGFIIEEGEAVGARLNSAIYPEKGATMSDLEPDANALMALFEYFIGNTDFSVNGLHNVELVYQPTGQMIPIAFDFDFSGAVNTTYATPDPSLNLGKVRDRLYRGYCQEPASIQKAIATFNAKKQAIYDLYADPLGQLLKPDKTRETLKYFDEFYKIINDPKRTKREIFEACVPSV
jgi:hypothetical protein